jgi:predicted SAM-dependent methyltransferase
MGVRSVARQFLPPVLTSLLKSLRRKVETAIARRRLAGCDRLHLACGANILEGWCNICLAGPREVIKLDLTRPFPVPANSVRFIFTEHFIEHIAREQAVAFLAECRRVMAPGGVIRISTPSLECVVEPYVAGRAALEAPMVEDPESPCKIINHRMRSWGHLFLYDRPELEALLTFSGFRWVTAVTRHLSRHPELAGLECREDHGDIILEAEK